MDTYNIKYDEKFKKARFEFYRWVRIKFKLEFDDVKPKVRDLILEFNRDNGTTYQNILEFSKEHFEQIAIPYKRIRENIKFRRELYSMWQDCIGPGF